MAGAAKPITDEIPQKDFATAVKIWRGLFKELKIAMPRDLVTMADGDEGGPVVPSEERSPVRLVGVDDDFEASAEDLAAQALWHVENASKGARWTMQRPIEFVRH